MMGTNIGRLSLTVGRGGGGVFREKVYTVSSKK